MLIIGISVTLQSFASFGYILKSFRFFLPVPTTHKRLSVLQQRGLGSVWAGPGVVSRVTGFLQCCPCSTWLGGIQCLGSLITLVWAQAGPSGPSFGSGTHCMHSSKSNQHQIPTLVHLQPLWRGQLTPHSRNQPPTLGVCGNF